MNDREESLFTAFTPSLIVEYINCHTKSKNVTYSEFKGFTKVNVTEYMLVLNFMDTCERLPEYINMESFNLFIVKKRMLK